MRGRPLGRWKDRIGENMCERGTGKGVVLEQGNKEFLDRER